MARSTKLVALGAALLGSALAFTMPANAKDWTPTRTITFVVPAGTGGGADQMAREIQGVAAKHKLLKRPMVVINESGGAGAQGFLDVKGSKGDANKIIITLSNLFTTPLATGVPFSWKDFTPVAMLELDEFVLWVNADTPYKTAKDYIDAVKKAPRQVQDGRHRLQAGRPDHHRCHRAEDRREVHLRALQGRRNGERAARRQAHQFSGQQPDRGGGATGAPAKCARSASSTTSGWTTHERSPRTCPGTISRPARRPVSTSSTSCCAVSSRRRASSRTQSITMSICSRRSRRRRTGRTSPRRRLQADLHDWRRVQRMARRCRQAPSMT